MKNFYVGLICGISIAYLSQIVISIAVEQDQNKYTLEPEQVLEQNVQHMSRSKLCKSCVEDMGQTLQEIPNMLRALAQSQEFLLNAVYEYLSKEKGGVLRASDKTHLQNVKIEMAQFVKFGDQMIQSSNKLIELL